MCRLMWVITENPYPLHIPDNTLLFFVSTLFHRTLVEGEKTVCSWTSLKCKPCLQVLFFHWVQYPFAIVISDIKDFLYFSIPIKEENTWQDRKFPIPHCFLS